MKHILHISLLLLLSLSAQGQISLLASAMQKPATGGGGGGGPTVPTTNMFAYFEADKGVTTGTGGVSQWNDQSGNGRHLTQGTTTRRPDIAGDSITFSSNDYLRMTASMTAPATIYFVVSVANVANGVNFLQEGSYFASFYYSSPDFNIGGFLTQNAGIINNKHFLVRVIYNGTANSSIQKNNGTTTTGDTYTNPTSPIDVGNSSSPGTSAMSIKGIYMFHNGTAPDADMKTYISSTYGITL